MSSTMIGGATTEIFGETLHLLPERAVYWEERRVLLVADLHWGKAATFRSAGLFVPRGTTGAGLARLDGLIEALDIERIVFLGDLLHAREGRAPRTLARLAEWRAQHPDLPLLLVRGNHDRGAGDPPDELRIDCVEEPFRMGPFSLSHFPKPVPGSYVLAGHIHPAVRLRGRGRQRNRLPCFWFGNGVAVLPAFGEFTGTGVIEPTETDHVWVVADGEVVRVDGSRDG